MRGLLLAIVLFFGSLLGGCEHGSNSNNKMAQDQEMLMGEGIAQAGIPTVVNFRERKLMKMLLELRDQELATFTYLYSGYQGKFVFLGRSLGFGIPAATQYTNPQVLTRRNFGDNYDVLPQADPNGLFMPSSAEGTWVMMAGPKGPSPCYIEERVLILPFELPPEKVL